MQGSFNSPVPGTWSGKD